jgi:hypothetical protein
MKEDLSQLSTEEIKKKLKDSRLVFGLFVGIFALIFVLAIVRLIYKNESFLSSGVLVQLCFLPICLNHYKQMKALKEELAKR